MAALAFSVSDYTQCGLMGISWSGGAGTGPWYLDIIPVDQSAGARYTEYSIDAGDSSPQYRQLSWPAGTRGLAAMYEGSGTYASVQAQPFTVGSGGSARCLNSNANNELDFYFSLSTDNPVQCGNLEVSWTSNFTAPASILMYVLGGKVYNIHTTSSSLVTSYSFPITLPSGSQFVLVMTDDGVYGLGGNSRIMTVGSSDDTSCLVTTTPIVSSSSTTTVYSSTTSSTTTVYSSTTSRTTTTFYSSTRPYPTPNPSPTDPDPADRPAVSTAAIAGGAAGGVAVLAILLAIGIFFCLRRRRNRRAAGHYDPTEEPDVVMTEDTKQVAVDESTYYTPTPLVYTAQTEPPIQSDKRTGASPRYTVMSE